MSRSIIAGLLFCESRGSCPPPSPTEPGGLSNPTNSDAFTLAGITGSSTVLINRTFQTIPRMEIEKPVLTLG